MTESVDATSKMTEEEVVDIVDNNDGNNDNNNNNDDVNKKDDNNGCTDEERIIINEFIRNDKAYLTNNSINTVIDLQSITILNLSNCNLTTLPDCLPTAVPNLRILFCSQNYFPILPIVVGRCKQLSMIAFKSCSMTLIPDDALQEQLRWLILTDNQLSALPDTIGRCTILQKFMLSGNKLSSLPSSIINCQRLELIRLASNQFTEPPIDLLSKIPSLKWIALSDNPFINDYVTNRLTEVRQSTVSSLPIIDTIPNDGEDGIVLGQGAGGITRKVLWKQSSKNNDVDNNSQQEEQYVAVKQYPKDVQITSDGSPEQEKMINCAIGAIILQQEQEQDSDTKKSISNTTTSAFIRVLGQTPSGGALVMEYLDNYISIAKLPNFDTCSRDVYDTTNTLLTLTTDQAITIVDDLLNCLHLLHTTIGIIHGDFYGHNILINTITKRVRLSDFGAAFFYDQSQLYGTLLQQIEVRSFLLFVQELQSNFLNTTTTTTTTLISKLLDRTTTTTTSTTETVVLVSTFEEIRIVWNQLKLQEISKVFNDFDPDTVNTTTTVQDEEETKV